MKTCLVTGGAGFIGSFLVDELIRRGYSVRIYDNLEPQVHPGGKTPQYLNPEAEFIQADIRDYDRLKNAMEGIDVIFHQAAMVGVGQSQYQVKRYVDVNIGGTANVLDILANERTKVSKIIVAASMSSYGEGQYECEECGTVTPALRSEEQMAEQVWELICPLCLEKVTPMPTNEEKKLECQSTYAITKKNQEEMVLNVGATYGIPAVALRYFNVYGPRQSLSNPYTGVAAIFLSRIKHGQSPVVFEDGLQTRDFVSVHDIVQANILAMEDETLSGYFNIGTGQPRTIRGIAETLTTLYGKKVSPEITGKFRKGDIRHCVADISKAKMLLEYEPQVTFEQGMQELIAWSTTAESLDKFEEARQELEKRGLV
ncbi:NAD-dependent epimerase/dehydratase [Candidatus Vecturithrix granuli]|uniref:NAD-dependent epimerase/dehydratase n=1 Tax=Vecturithrix granuli TaxID=1499967 RepID=A0A081C8P8_VECG1|nr:NAD-dependent epimerase/dehydratase [Candidatus Vecturithrix granuli]